MREITSSVSVALLIGISMLCAIDARAADITVTTTIQAAVDQAGPGDTVVVPPGVYRENVTVNRDNITIRGSRAAILDGTDTSGANGIRVVPTTSSSRINGFHLQGMTIRNYRRNGIFLSRVDNFTVSDGVYENDAEYGIYPIRSSQGVVERNQVSGSLDSGVYIGQSRSIIIRGNSASNNLLGIEIENCSYVEATDNFVTQNSVGIAVTLLPGLGITVSEHILLKNNTSVKNNRPNLITDPEEIFSGLPGGVGILVLGGDFVEVRKNIVTNNASSGIAIVRLPSAISDQDPRIDPFPDNDLVTDNTLAQNGTDPDARLAPLPGVDLTWDLTGTGNNWVKNRFRTSFPAPLP